MSKFKPSSVEEYINAAPPIAREKLQEIRSILKDVAPDATEMLKWGNPVFIEKRILFAYSAYKDHINFMPTGPAMKPFGNELSEFTTGNLIQSLLKYDLILRSALVPGSQWKVAANRDHKQATFN